MSGVSKVRRCRQNAEYEAVQVTDAASLEGLWNMTARETEADSGPRIEITQALRTHIVVRSGDWLIRKKDGRLSVLWDTEFRKYYHLTDGEE
jgi:hypothetical protein